MLKLVKCLNVKLEETIFVYFDGKLSKETFATTYLILIRDHIKRSEAIKSSDVKTHHI